MFVEDGSSEVKSREGDVSSGQMDNVTPQACPVPSSVCRYCTKKGSSLERDNVVDITMDECLYSRRCGVCGVAVRLRVESRVVDETFGPFTLSLWLVEPFF